MGDAGWRDDRDAAWPSGQNAAQRRQPDRCEYLAADPLAKPGQIIDGATWTRTLGWTEHRQVRYATARSVFTWRGTDSVSVGSEETAVRVLDEEVTTDQTRWRNRYWVDSEGQIRQTEQYLGANYFPVKTTLIKAAKS